MQICAQVFLTLVFNLCELFVVVLQCLSKFGVLCLNVVHPLELQLQLLSQLQHRYRVWGEKTHCVNTLQSRLDKQGRQGRELGITTVKAL